MAERIRLKILTASGTLLDEAAGYVSLPMPDGSLGVLPGHVPMLCALGAGRIRCRLADGTERSVEIEDGVASVERGELTALVREAEKER